MCSKICVPFWMKSLLHLVRCRNVRLGWKSWCIKSTLVARLNVNFFIAYPVVFVLSEADGGLWLKVAEETAGRNETAGPAPEATAGLRVEPAAMLTGTNWTGPAPPGHQGKITDSLFDFVFIQMTFLKLKLNPIFRGKNQAKQSKTQYFN